MYKYCDIENLPYLKTCHPVVLVLSCGNGRTAGQNSCKRAGSHTGSRVWRVVGFLQHTRTPNFSVLVLNQNGRQVLQSVLTEFCHGYAIRATYLQLNTFKCYELNNTVIGQLIPSQIFPLCQMSHPLLSFI